MKNQSSNALRALQLIPLLLLAAGLATAQDNRGNAAPRAPLFGGAQPGTALVVRLAQMTPEERERALDNLPGPQRVRLMAQLERFRNMTVEDQARLRAQTAALNRLSPERQEAIRQSLRDFNALEPGRRRVITREMRALALLPPGERRAVIGSEEFTGRFSASERRVIADLAEIMPQDAPLF